MILLPQLWRRMRKSLRSAEYQRLIELLVETRRKAGVRQQTLADAIGKPQSFIAKYEGGERRIDLVEFITIAKALGADPERLLRAYLADEAQSKRAGRKLSDR